MSQMIMNSFEIDQYITEKMSVISSQSELEELKAFVKKEKNKKEAQPFVSSIRQVYYSYYTKVRSQGSGKVIGERLKIVNNTSFVFMGVEVYLPENKEGYKLNAEEYNHKDIWIDRTIKYGGVEYFPKTPTNFHFGIDLEKVFFEYLKTNGFYIVKRSPKSCFLCKDSHTERKILTGRRLNKFDTGIKIDVKYIDYLGLNVKENDLYSADNYQLKTHETFDSMFC